MTTSLTVNSDNVMKELVSGLRILQPDTGNQTQYLFGLGAMSNVTAKKAVLAPYCSVNLCQAS